MTTVLRGATLIDGTGADALPNSVVVIEDQRISRVGVEADFGSSLPAKKEDILDLTGCFIVPGLINCHEHLDMRRAPRGFHERVAKDSLYTIMRSVRNCLVNLQEGITTVRDLHSKDLNSLYIKQGVDEGMLVGPRVFTCGTPISMTGGHAEEVCLIADGVDAVRKAARTLLRAGADIIKVMASGGFVSVGRDLPTSPQLTVEEMRAAFDEAHRAGKPTTAHAHAPQAIRNAIEAGVDCIEHGGLLDRETAAFMARKNIPLIATVSGIWIVAEHGLELARPKWLVDVCRSGFEQWLNSLKQTVETGVTIGAGTDGGDMFRELLLLHEAGLSPMQVIESATRIGAEILCQQDNLGTVEPGKFADMVVLTGDPLADLNHMRRIKLVFKDGVAYDPAALAAATGQWPL